MQSTTKWAIRQDQDTSTFFHTELLKQTQGKTTTLKIQCKLLQNTWTHLRAML